jgi:hypothetical protein
MRHATVVLALAALAAGCERKPGRIGEATFLASADAAFTQAKAEGKPVFLEFWSED